MITAWDAQLLCQGWLLAYPVWLMFPVSRSWWLSDIYCCRPLQHTYSDPSLYWQTFLRISSQDQIYNLLGHWNNPWSQSWLQVLNLWFWCAYSYLCTSWNWMLVPFFQSISSTCFLQGNVWFISDHNLRIFLSLVLFSIFVCRNICMGFVRLEMPINFLLASILDRQHITIFNIPIHIIKGT